MNSKPGIQNSHRANRSTVGPNGNCGRATRRRRSWLGDRSGATAIEYGLIAALIAVAMLASLTVLGDSTKSLFNYILAQYQAAA